VAKKKQPPTDSRRARVEELRSQQKAAERKRTLLLVGVFALVGLVMIGLAVIPLVRNWQENNRAFSEIGVAADAAGCTDISEDATSGNNDHVEDGTRVEYETAPPSSGAHYAVTAGFSRQFYTPDDTPPLENLVHNLEHGASIIWYDETVSDADVDVLEQLSDKLVEVDPKIIVAAWDSEDRGDLEGGPIALSHWGNAPAIGYRMYCERPSGEAISQFVEDHPYTDSPEPNGG
jgi:hypothetical protein